jgi:hypothetical protein
VPIRRTIAQVAARAANHRPRRIDKLSSDVVGMRRRALWPLRCNEGRVEMATITTKDGTNQTEDLKKFDVPTLIL